MPTVAIPASHVKTSSTGSSPAIAQIAISSPAVTVCTSEATCGEACREWLRPQAAGRTPVLPRAKKYRDSTLWKDRTQANRLVTKSTCMTSAAIGPTNCSVVATTMPPGSARDASTMAESPHALTTAQADSA